MDKEERLKAFRSELQDLLRKHECTIDFICSECSDTHGITNGGMAVSFDNGNGKPHRLNWDWYLDSTHLG